MSRWLPMFILLSLTPAVMAAIEIRGPRDVDTLPASEPVLVSGYRNGDLQHGELRRPESAGPFPVAVVVHGGYWTAGFATARNTAPLASALANNGLATWSIGYRQVGDDGGSRPATFQHWATATDHPHELTGRQPLDLSRATAIGRSPSPPESGVAP